MNVKKPKHPEPKCYEDYLKKLKKKGEITQQEYDKYKKPSGKNFYV